MTEPKKIIWTCDQCDWYATQFAWDDPAWASTPTEFYQRELARHKKAVHPKNPLKDLWSKRNSSSGFFRKLKSKGIWRVKSEN